MTSILEIYRQDGHSATLKAHRGGEKEEWGGTCPRCGGTKHFRLWPRTGRYWCRECEIQGDEIQYLRDFRGMGFREAKQYLGLNGDDERLHVDKSSFLPSDPKPDQGQCIMPIPSDAPRAAEHPTLGKPDQTWIYRTPEGQPAFYVVRWNTPDGKEIRPLTLWKSSNGGLTWRWKDPPRPKPLCNLHRLAERKDLPVLIVEGEKSCDAATKRLTGFVCMTSSGGCGRAGETDWSPLAGRDCVLWPDADRPGMEYANKVAAILTKAGAAEIRIVSLPADLPSGWDLGDQWPEGLDPERLIQEARPWSGSDGEPGTVAPDLEPGTAPESLEGDHTGPDQGSGIPHGFELRPGGLYSVGVDKEGKPFEQWICGRLEVRAMTRTSENTDWGRLLVFRDNDGVEHSWSMPISLLAATNAGELLQTLYGLGLNINTKPSARNKLIEYLARCQPEARCRCVSRIGWHDGAYILPGETIGGDDIEDIVFQSLTGANDFMQCGNLADWQKTVGAWAVGNSRLAFGLMVGLSGPLLPFAGLEGGGGFHLRGASSCGKSTILKAVASLWGPPNTFMKSWRTTGNAVDYTSLARNHNILILDEMGVVNGKEAGSISYQISNGVMKSRLSRDATPREVPTWETVFLSSGEISLSQKMNEAGETARAGQEIRCLDIAVDTGQFGAFESLHGFPDGAAFANVINRAAAVNHGHAGRVFIERLLTVPTILPGTIENAIDRFCKSNVPPKSDGQTVRAAQRFGLAMVAGELAAVWKILPWPEVMPSKIAGKLFQEWLEGRGGSGQHEERQAIDQVRHFVQVNEKARFQEWGRDPDRTIINRAGYLRDGDYLIFPKTFSSEVCRGLDPRAVAKTLIKHGWLEPDQHGKSSINCKVAGQNQRFYLIKGNILSDGTGQTQDGNT